MKKLLCMLLTLGLLLNLLPVQVWGQENRSLVLFLGQNDAAGLHGKITVALDAGNSGTIYLPGAADAENLHLFFTGVEEVKVDGKTYLSGLAPIPAPGKSMTYTLSDGSFTLRTMQGSESVAALFLEVDETRGTISAMNKDRNKNTECFGSLNMDGEAHYMSMKGRGNTTWTNFDKKPYNITVFSDAECTVKEAVKFIDGVKTKKWSLIANAKDSTLLRNRLGLHMANELGIGMETRFVDVWLNGEYRGNYLLTPKNDYQAPDNGYMLEIDNSASAGDETFSVRGFTGSRTPSFTVKDNGAGISTSEIKAYIQEASTAILDKSSTKYLDYIDVESWAKMCLLQEFYKNTDVVSGSLFMYRNGLEPEDKIFGGPVWDLDVAMGRGWPKSVTTVEDEAQVSGGKWYIDNIQTDAWYQVLCKHPEITSRMYELYNAYREVFDSVPDFVASENAAIQASADMNFDLWDVNRDKDHNPYTCEKDVSYGSGDYQVNFIAADDREDYLTNFNEYIEKRLLFLSDNLGVETPVGTITGNLNPKDGEMLILSATLTAGNDDPTYQWQSTKSGGAWEDIPSATEKTYSVKATPELTGTSIRCRVRNNGQRIETQKIAKVKAGASAILEPVTLAVDIGAHTHDYRKDVTPPTCTQVGFTTYTCTLCGEVTVGDETPALDHDIVDGSCIRCGMKPYKAQFRADHAAVTVYASQQEGCDTLENPTFVYARDGDSGIISADGGQVNFTVIPDAGYQIVSVAVTPTENYKNLKPPAETGSGYRVTKVTGDLTITVITESVTCQHEFVDGKCIHCGQKAYRADFICDDHCTVTVYDTQTLENGIETDHAFAKNSEAGIIDLSGDGQVNFVVTPAPGYEVTSVTAAPANFKNLKTPVDTLIPNYYRITKITGDLTVTVKTEKTVCQHIYVSIVTPPTCTEKGYTTYTCSKCGESYMADETAKIPHEFVNGECILCHSKLFAVHFLAEHATVTVYESQAVDSPCVENPAVVYARNGDTGSYDLSGDGQVNFTVQPEDGYTIVSVTAAPKESYKNLKLPEETGTGYRVTKIMGDVTITVTTEKTECPHTYVAKVTAPTCTEGGYTTYTCAKCGESYVDDPTAALGHDYKTVVTLPTCTEGGYTTSICTRCGDSYIGSHTNARGHDLKETRVEATCTSAGSVTKACSRCDYKEVTALPALGHDYKAAVTAPTCTAGGYTTYTCTRCANSYKGNETAALGHDLKETTVDATCTTGGKVTRECTRCDYKQTVTVAALGHDYKAVVTAPTCTAGGYTTHTCIRCGDSYKGNETAALGHDLKETKTDATCTAAGKVTKECTRCDYKETVAIAALGHDYKTVVTPSTCTAGGYTTYTCTRCGDSYKGNETAALGHNLKETRVEPTCITSGKVTQECTRCDYSEIAEIPALEHDYVNGICIRCGEKNPDYVCDGGEACPAKNFTDAPKPDSWAHGGIDFCIENGFMNGMSDTLFVPNGTVTRGQLVTILYRIAGKPAASKEIAFTDVEYGRYYTEAVQWAAENGMVNGYNDGTFRPDVEISREQIATILYRYAGSPDVTGTLDFPDSGQAGNYAKDALLWATQNELITGVKTMDSTILAPKANATRAQIATIIMRYMQ